ncbi:LuxR C-terminal-related transcriptional regulator [Intrasporangium sp.]|uniref:helix-turn-helix transcriptional regulator n=1 Tax=Intrasporangium sp. TaxID=1925024 RepID=UPI0033655D0F
MGESFVTGRDARRILDIVGDATAEDPGELFYSSVLRGIAELVPCEMVTLQLSDIGHHSIDGLRLVGGRTVRHAQSLDETYAFWSAYFEPGGCSYDAIRPGLPDYSLVVRRSDRFGDREYLRFAMGRVMRGWSVRHELLAAMQPFGALDRRLLLFRSDGTDFTDREVEIVRLIRPHVGELHLRRVRELAGEPNLTSRQWEVLRLVSLGASNHQIGSHLGISEATVRKHLENIYLRVGAASRTEAIRKVSGFL